MKATRRTVIATGALAMAAGAASAKPTTSAKLPLTPHQAALDVPDPSEVIALWPKGPPGGEGVTLEESVVPRPNPPAGMRDRFRQHIRTPVLRHQGQQLLRL